MTTPPPAPIPASSVVPINIEAELRSSYLDYSMSVIVGRALPSARDGLKPVHRRILYAMFREGLLHNRRYSKCAGVVGEVLKKYHPHGDSAVYDALVRMAQPWNLRYPLVDGQGNFGSVDGDAAAAYRYTESRLTRLAEELLADIDKETVDFQPNFDGQTVEPIVLPTRIPNLLINGSAGIAVGMATNIAPHNLGEVVRAAIALVDDPELPDHELLNLVPGPDFPTGGVIYGREGCIEAAKTGRGRVIVRAVAEIEKDERGDDARIVVTEIPYQVNKARLIETIAELVRDKKLDGIRAVDDHSDREGMRIVVELKRDAIGPIVLNQLYKHTAMQSTFGVINLALVDGRPRVLSLRELLSEFLLHRKEVTVRRCRFELAQAEARAHVLEGYLRALDVIDEIIRIIRASSDTDQARASLIAAFDFTHVQAQAILDMRLARLTALERDKLIEELAAVRQEIERLRAILSDERLVYAVIRAELEEVLRQYGDARRTRIEDTSADLTLEDLVPDDDCVVTVSHLGYVKRTVLREYQQQRRGGTGKKGMDTREEDFVRDLFAVRTHDRLMAFTDQGRVYLLPVFQVPEGGRAARGRPFPNLLPLQPDERVSTTLAIREFDERLVMIVTRLGQIVRTPLSLFKNIRANGIIGCSLREGDSVLCARLVDDATGNVLLASGRGKSIHFPVDEVREVGRGAQGVRAMDLMGEAVVAMEVVPANHAETDLTVLTVTERGYGKRTPIGEYRLQHRGGMGIITIDTGERNGAVVGLSLVHENDDVMVITDHGKIIRMHAAEIRLTQSRGAAGVRLIRLEDDERVVRFVRLLEPTDDRDAAEAVAPTDSSVESEAVQAATDSTNGAEGEGNGGGTE